MSRSARTAARARCHRWRRVRLDLQSNEIVVPAKAGTQGEWRVGCPGPPLARGRRGVSVSAKNALDSISAARWRHFLLEPVVGVGIVVVTGDFAIALPPVERDCLDEHPVGVEAQ